MAATTAQPISALKFFGETLATADGDQFTPEKYQHLLDEICAAAGKDPEIKMLVVLQKGPHAAVFGVINSELTEDRHQVGEVLLPIARRL